MAAWIILPITAILAAGSGKSLKQLQLKAVN